MDIEPYVVSSEIAINLPKIVHDSLSNNRGINNRLEEVINAAVEIFLRKQELTERTISKRRPFLRSSWLYRGERYVNPSNMKYAITLSGLYESGLIMGLDLYDSHSISTLERLLTDIKRMVDARKRGSDLNITLSNNHNYLSPPFRFEPYIQGYMKDSIFAPYLTHYSSAFVPEWLRISLDERTRIELTLARHIDSYVMRFNIGEPAPTSAQIFKHMAKCFELGARAVEYNRIYTYCTACSSTSYGYNVKCPVCGGRGKHLRRYARLKPSYHLVDRRAKRALDVLSIYTAEDF